MRVRTLLLVDRRKRRRRRGYLYIWHLVKIEGCCYFSSFHWFTLLSLSIERRETGNHAYVYEHFFFSFFFFFICVWTHKHFSSMSFFFCSFWWYTTRDEGKNWMCVFTTPRYETKTDIKKEMGSLSLFFYVFFFLNFLSRAQKKIDDDERQGNMRQHRLRIELNDKRWI
jgi:hypothetical protein